MALRPRPAFVNAMAKRGIDVAQATRQEMRTYVCAQCHVEYYFAGDDKVLTFPWEKGLTIDDIEAYYTEVGFKDWTTPRPTRDAQDAAPRIRDVQPGTARGLRRGLRRLATCPTCAKGASRSRTTGSAAR